MWQANVTIVNNKKILAYGYDSKNRKQVIYNSEYIKKQNSQKYDKIEAKREKNISEKAYDLFMHKINDFARSFNDDVLYLKNYKN
jgi:hypothetical protein